MAETGVGGGRGCAVSTLPPTPHGWLRDGAARPPPHPRFGIWGPFVAFWAFFGLQSGQIAQNGPKWLKMAQNGPKMTQNGLKWPRPGCALFGAERDTDFAPLAAEGDC